MLSSEKSVLRGRENGWPGVKNHDFFCKLILLIRDPIFFVPHERKSNIVLESLKNS